MEREQMPPTGNLASQSTTTGVFGSSDGREIEELTLLSSAVPRIQSRPEPPVLPQAILQGRMLSPSKIEVIVVLSEVNRVIALGGNDEKHRFTTI
jgi:hypothetical protein